jgi:predicted TIM-barrel fold metal-dependent hydrolase
MVKRPGADDFLYGLNGELGKKMLFGTAYPFLSFESSLDWARKTVREDVLEDYLYNNAAQILGI